MIYRCFFPVFFPWRRCLQVSLDREAVQNIAHLARLTLSEAEVTGYTKSLSSIIDLVGQLDGAKTADVEPMSHPLPGLVQRLRPDEVTETDQRVLYQQNAPQVEAGLYLVPKVIE